jgi:hypothetical protein
MRATRPYQTSISGTWPGSASVGEVSRFAAAERSHVERPLTVSALPQALLEVDGAQLIAVLVDRVGKPMDPGDEVDQMATTSVPARRW